MAGARRGPAGAGHPRALPHLTALSEAIGAGSPPPGLVLAQVLAPPTDGQWAAAAVHTVTGQTLDLVQAWLADERLAEAKLGADHKGPWPLTPPRACPGWPALR